MIVSITRRLPVFDSTAPTARLSRRLFLVTLGSLLLAGCSSYVGDRRSLVPLSSATVSKLDALGSSAAQAMLVRIFKEESQLEIWKRVADGSFALFTTYPICRWSGILGPKLQEGDRQAPEGFYAVSAGMLNPKSALYLSFNTGFPNKYDRALGRTGTNLMVHGGCSSAGCYAMTDDQIKEIYAMARESFAAGNENFQLQMFPFRMSAENMARFAGNPNIDFWTNIKEGYDLFETTRRAPAWDVCEFRYVFALAQEDIKGERRCQEQPPVPAPIPSVRSA